jgi:hypothetical protein
MISTMGSAMANKERVPLQAQLMGGKLTVPGDENVHFPPFDDKVYISGRTDISESPAIIPTLWIEASDLWLLQQVEVMDGSAYRQPSIECTGKLHRQTLWLAGWGDSCKVLPLTIQPTDDEASAAKLWYAEVGFVPAEPDFKTEDSWYCSVIIPRDFFQTMLEDFKNQELKGFTLGLNLDTWITESNRYSPAAYVRDQFLVPSLKSPSTFPEHARGRVRVIRWGAKRKLNQIASEEATAEKPVAVPSFKSTEPSPDTIVAIEKLREETLKSVKQLLAKQNRIVGLLVVAMIVLLAITGSHSGGH